MSLIPFSIQQSCESVLRSPITSITALSGGDINEARLLNTSNGAFFLKFNKDGPATAMLKAEKRGLDLIASTGSILTPHIVHLDQTEEGAYLLLEYIEAQRPNAAFWEKFGQQLAALHRNRSKTFGLDHSNFIGSLPQHNPPQKTAVDFLIHDRLGPQLKSALDSGLLQANEAGMMESLFKKLPRLIPDETPSLIHGDLWSGNFMANTDGQPVLIDPAVAFGPREMDIAMSLLFGGFDPLFYRAYENSYLLLSDWKKRMDIYQLYYLLVHLNIFGRSYAGSVRRILQKYQ